MAYMNNTARPKNWKTKAAHFLHEVWKPFRSGYVFIATKDSRTDRWRDHSITLPASRGEIKDLLRQFPRKTCDLYFCPNAFSKPKRKEEFGKRTPYAWVDIDDADPDKFCPKPRTLIETSPGRFQGVWRFKQWHDVTSAQHYSKVLAYKFGADRNGWSVTKYLRIPFTRNHKKAYSFPEVQLLKADFKPRLRLPIQFKFADPVSCNPSQVITSAAPNKNWRKIYERYRQDLHPRTQDLITSKKAYAYERDRSKCIFEMIVGLLEAGATLDEIASVIWPNPYFRSKRGLNWTALTTEIESIANRVRKTP